MKILDDSGYPMMSEKEVDIINSLIEKNKPEFCLEWGSGNSTVYFPTRHPEIKEWIAVEHNKTYHELLNSRLPSNASINIIPDDERYINYPETLGKKFDFILIDGQKRDDCVDASFKYANERAIILLHDAFRIESKGIIERYKGRFKKLIDGEQMTNTGYFAHRGLILFKA